MLDHMIIACLGFKETAKLFSIEAVPFYPVPLPPYQHLMSLFFILAVMIVCSDISLWFVSCMSVMLMMLKIFPCADLPSV